MELINEPISGNASVNNQSIPVESNVRRNGLEDGCSLLKVLGWILSVLAVLSAFASFFVSLGERNMAILFGGLLGGVALLTFGMTAIKVASIAQYLSKEK